MNVGSNYDILAVKPTTEKTFVESCTSILTDIITFDFSKKLDFKLHIPTLRTAINRGVYFEINVSTLLNDNDVVDKQRFVSNATDLTLFTKGKNIIISSGTVKDELFKSSNDLVTMGILLGLSRKKAYESVYINPINCIIKAHKRFALNSMIAKEN